jgi:protein TonB
MTGVFKVQSQTHETVAQNPRTELARYQPGAPKKQPRQLQIALVLLLVALVVVLQKERDFWFGSDDGIEADATVPKTTLKPNSAPASAPAPAKIAQAPVTPAPAAIATEKLHSSPKTSTDSAVTASVRKDVTQKHPQVATKRAVLPPLQVEVVASESPHAVQPGSKASKVEISGDSKRAPAVTTSVNLPANAAERERLSPPNAPELRQAVEAAYPLLGQHTMVQGSVVLQAVVGADGIIENLRVLSGPGILAAAAQQAVRQWRFKPYLQNGQPVETKATITVNFSIRVNDNPAKTS